MGLILRLRRKYTQEMGVLATGAGVSRALAGESVGDFRERSFGGKMKSLVPPPKYRGTNKSAIQDTMDSRTGQHHQTPD